MSLKLWGQPVYGPIRDILISVSNGGLLIAISALGLGTSLAAIFSLSWRHIGLMLLVTLLMLFVVAAGVTIAR